MSDCKHARLETFCKTSLHGNACRE